MRTTGKRIAIGMGVAVVVVATGFGARLELFPYEVRYEVGDIMSKIRSFPGPMIHPISQQESTPSNDEDAALACQVVAEMILEGCGGEESGLNVHPADAAVIVKGRFDQHIQVRQCLRALRSP